MISEVEMTKGDEFVQFLAEQERKMKPTNTTNVNVIRGGDDFPHGIHLILTMLSCGLWLPMWIGLYILVSLTRR